MPRYSLVVRLVFNPGSRSECLEIQFRGFRLAEKASLVKVLCLVRIENKKNRRKF